MEGDNFFTASCSLNNCLVISEIIIYFLNLKLISESLSNFEPVTLPTIKITLKISLCAYFLLLERFIVLYINNPSHDPYYNQALEEYIFENKTEDYILLWRNSPAVICGKFQNLFAEVYVAAAKKSNVALIRRISGGGTVYHDLGNINYSIIRNVDSSNVDYAEFLNPVIKVLKEVGVDANIIAGNGIGIGDKKISGSAQRIVKGRVLHHGTLLFSADLNRLKSLANGHREYFTSSGTASVPWPVTNISDYMDSKMTVDEFYKLLSSAFKNEFPGEEGMLSEIEIGEIKALAEGKYRSFEWNFGKGPKVKFEREVMISGDSCRISYEVIKGNIKNVMTVPEIIELNLALEGLKSEISEMTEALVDKGFGDLTEYII